MALRNQQYILENAPFSGTVKMVKHDTAGILLGYSASDPTEANVWAVQALVDVAGTWKYNSGTKANPVWSPLIAAASGGSFTNIAVSGTADITGAASFGSTVDISGDLTADNADFAGTLKVGTGNAFSVASNGAVTIAGNKLVFGADGSIACVTDKFIVSAAGAGAFASTLSCAGDFTVNTSYFVVAAATGAVTCGNITGLAQHMTITSGGTAKNMTINASTTGTMNIATTSTGNVSIGNSSISAIDLTAGTTTITGNLVVTSGTITGTYSISSLSAATLTFTGSNAVGPAITLNGNALTNGTVLSLSGDGLTSGKFISADINGAEKYSVGFDGRTAIAGTAAANVLMITAGDITFADGSVTIVDADNATTFSVTNDTVTSGTLLSIAGSAAITGIGAHLNFAGLTTGTALKIDVPSLTSGVGVYIAATDGAGLTGKYIECHDGAADDFSVSRYGATVIAGNAGGTAALTLTAGDIVMSSGRINITSTTDVANSIVRSAASAGTAAVLTIQASNAASVNDLLFLNQDGTGVATTLQIDSEGTGDCITIACKATNASVIKATSEVATGVILEGIMAASTTVSAIGITHGGTGATGWLGNTNTGLVDLVVNGNLAQTTASVLRISYTGAPQANALGSSIAVYDAGSVNTASAVYVSTGASAGTALNIAASSTADTVTITSAASAASAVKVTTSATDGTILELIGAASSTVSLVSIDGTTGAGWLGAENVGMLHLVADGNLAHANASCLYIAYSGTGAATGLGTSIRVVDTGATNTSSAVYMSAANAANVMHLVGGATSVVKIEGTATNVFNIMDANSFLFRFNASGDGGATVGNMTAKNPETDSESGYIRIQVNGTTYEIPFYAIV